MGGVVVEIDDAKCGDPCVVAYAVWDRALTRQIDKAWQTDVTKTLGTQPRVLRSSLGVGERLRIWTYADRGRTDVALEFARGSGTEKLRSADAGGYDHMRVVRLQNACRIGNCLNPTTLPLPLGSAVVVDRGGWSRVADRRMFSAYYAAISSVGVNGEALVGVRTCVYPNPEDQHASGYYYSYTLTGCDDTKPSDSTRLASSIRRGTLAVEHVQTYTSRNTPQYVGFTSARSPGGGYAWGVSLWFTPRT